MNEAALLIYVATIIAAISLAWSSYKIRFSPVARPIVAMCIVFTLFSISNIIRVVDLETSQLVAQLIQDFDFLLVSIVAPLWIWVLVEYQAEDTKPFLDIRILLFLIHPLILVTLFTYDVIINGFLSQESSSTLVEPVDRIGVYARSRVFYGWLIFVIITIITPYIIIKKQRTSFWRAIQVVLFSAAPFITYALYHTSVIHIRLTGPIFVAYFYWLSHQYRLLDIMPVALQKIIDKVGSGILVSNLKPELLYANNHASNVLGLRQSPEVLKQYGAKIPPVFQTAFNFLSTEKQQSQLVLDSADKKHNNRYLDARLEPIFDPDTKKHLGATVSFHDVTERKQAELKLQSLDRQKSEFFAGISHEFRTPLTLSLGHLKDLANDAENITPDELRNGLFQVENNNKRLLKLVNQLLQLSKLDAGSLKIKPKLLNLKAHLPILIANFESLAQKQGIRIHLQLDHRANDDFAVYFDVEAFGQVISNLLSNALKSMPNGGDVYVQLKVIDEQIFQLSISDTGCGIPASALPNVFEMFYSHQSDNAAWPQGTGVGLSLVKRLLNQHGAEITVNSIETEGTTFTVNLIRGYSHFSTDIEIQRDTKAVLKTIPSESTEIQLEQSNVEALALEKSAEKKAIIKAQKEMPGESILLVEDNTEMRAYICKHLNSDYHVVEAADGEEALTLALQSIPDLVLSDVMMPKMNGYDLCRQLKSNPLTSHIPVLLLTAKSSQSDKLEGLELGADDYLNKPFNVQELLLRMKNLIHSRSIIRQFYQNNGLNQVIDNPELPKRETTFLDKLQKYVHKNISASDIKVSDLASAVNMSERTLNRKLKALTGDTPKKMLLLIRLEYAAKLLDETDDSITQISYSAGFADTSHFTRCFKSHYRVTPTNYRKARTQQRNAP